MVMRPLVKHQEEKRLGGRYNGGETFHSSSDWALVASLVNDFLVSVWRIHQRLAPSFFPCWLPRV